jgi:hypothetical protein
VTPLRVVNHRLRKGGPPPAAFYFVFDPRSTLDLLDFWNMRAFGLAPVPVPADCISHAAAVHAQLGLPPGRHVNRRPIVAQSPRLGGELAKAFVDGVEAADESFDAVAQRTNHFAWSFPFVLRDAERVSIYTREERTEASAESGRLQFTCKGPQFAHDGSWSPGPEWAADVVLSEMGVGSELAEVLPPDLKNLSRTLSAMGSSHPVTMNRDGIALRASGKEDRQFWRALDGTTVFQEWFSQQGIAVRMSGAGRTTLEAIRALGGSIGAGMVTDTALIKLLGRAAEGLMEEESEAGDDRPQRGRVISYQAMLKVANSIAEGRADRAFGRISALTDAGVIAPLVRLRCSQCDHRNWLPPGELDESITCERCARTFHFPAERPPGRDDWGYRPIGPFAASGYAHGAYAVALSIRFLGQLSGLSSGETWSVGLEAVGDTSDVEIDYAMLLKPEVWRRADPDLLFGEAKSFGQFEAKDFTRAARMLKAFPAAHFAFSTLRDELTPEEKARLERLVRSERTDRGFYPRQGRVLVLTSAELCQQISLGPTYHWKSKGGRLAEVAEKHRRADHELSVLSDATLEAYADVTWRE